MKLTINSFLFLLILCSCSKERNFLEGYLLQDENLDIQVVAAEPDILAPVAIDFDREGRMWVAEMPDYMPDINGANESIPAGRIVVMEDRDGDGTMEHAKVFLDSLHHLRAIRLFRNGILYAEDPNLIFTEIINDTPGATIIIDSTYSSGGNLEHKSNGLLQSVDNCFYSAKSHYRYCYDEGGWSKEVVYFRGQWGLTEDKNGRIYTNDNSNFLFGDGFLPGMFKHNRFIRPGLGINGDLVGNREVYPIQATAINRGYNEGMLDDDGLLRNTTSACGLYIYNGDGLGLEYNGAVFICVPEANLIKQLEMDQDVFQQKASFAYDSSEILVSTDKAFRPVNLMTGYDGNLYIVDFHRGIIQHKIYMTNYLREKIQEQELDKIVNYGRILKISHVHQGDYKPRYDFKNLDSLVCYLSSPNAWLQKEAQEELVYGDFSDEVVSKALLEKFNGGQKFNRIRLLWTMAGRGNIDLKKILSYDLTDSWTIANLFKIIATKDYKYNDELITSIFRKYANTGSRVVNSHLVAALHVLYPIDRILHDSLWTAKYKVPDIARLSAFPDGEKILLPGEMFQEYNASITSNQIYYIHKEKDYSSLDEDGYKLYNKFCSSCHGYGGMGATGQAPALVGAELVNGDVTLVPLIMMHGLKGEVSVNGATEQYGAVMPAFMESASLDSHDIASISNYIFNAFRSNVARVSISEIDSLMMRYNSRRNMWTESELLGTDWQ